MKLGLERRKMLSGYMFISPWIIGFLAFMVYPLFKSIYISFHKVTNVSEMTMQNVGLKNFSRAFLKDTQFIPYFMDAVKDALINIPLVLVFSFFIATLLNHSIRGRAFFRGAFFLPVIIGTGFVMQQLLGEGVGAAQNAAAMTDASTAGNSVTNGIMVPDAIWIYFGPKVGSIMIDVISRLTLVFWKTGIQILLFLAGLQGISESLYESAKCDGATPWEMFWKITFPLMTPVLLLNAVFTLIDSFTDMSSGIMHYIETMAFTNIDFGYAAAMGWIYFVFIFLLVVLIFFFTRKNVVYVGDR